MELLGKNCCKLVIFAFLCFLFIDLFSQSNINTSPIIEQIRSAYEKNTLRHNDEILIVTPSDTSTIAAMKNYFRAVLHNDVQEIILIHQRNFNSFPNEYYGIMSALQLVSIDFINHEYDNALILLNRINNDNIPEVLYYRIKISQVNQKYDEAIRDSQIFLRQHPNHHLASFVWLVILESLYHKADLLGFERNYSTFSENKEFDEYKPYLMYLNALLIESSNMNRARTLFSQIINDFPNSQYRVQAEDRLFALRLNADRTATPTQTPSSGSTTFTNITANRYEDLMKDRFYIQFGVFSTESAARNFVNTLNRDRIQTFYISKPVGGRRLFAVIQGPYQTIENAQTNQRIYNSRNHQTFVFKAE